VIECEKAGGLRVVSFFICGFVTDFYGLSILETTTGRSLVAGCAVSGCLALLPKIAESGATAKLMNVSLNSFLSEKCSIIFSDINLLMVVRGLALAG
jgi:hypothetical protein